MTASELRIGNFVKDKNTGDIFPIGNIVPSSGNWDNCIPIPLTQEILLKCGFTHNGGYSWDCKLLGRQRFIVNHLTRGYFETHYTQYNYGKHIESLHQLQNFYFIAVNEELKIEL